MDAEHLERLTGRRPIRFDVSEAFAQQLRDAANREHRTTSNFVRSVLVKHLAQPEDPDDV